MHERHADILLQTVQRASRLRFAVHLNGEHPPIRLQIVHDAPLEHLIVHQDSSSVVARMATVIMQAKYLKIFFFTAHLSGIRRGGGFSRAV